MKINTKPSVDVKWSHPMKGKARDAYDAIEAIRKKRGGKVRPAHVVEAARSKTSPLHRYFTWDDTEAAKKWRIEQARQLIVNIDIVVVPNPDANKPITIQARAFNSLPGDDGRWSFQRADIVLSNEVDSDAFLKLAMKRLREIRVAFGHIKQLKEVVDAIDRLLGD